MLKITRLLMQQSACTRCSEQGSLSKNYKHKLMLLVLHFKNQSPVWSSTSFFNKQYFFKPFSPCPGLRKTISNLCGGLHIISQRGVYGRLVSSKITRSNFELWYYIFPSSELHPLFGVGWQNIETISLAYTYNTLRKIEDFGRVL